MTEQKINKPLERVGFAMFPFTCLSNISFSIRLQPLSYTDTSPYILVHRFY